MLYVESILRKPARLLAASTLLLRLIKSCGLDGTVSRKA